MWAGFAAYLGVLVSAGGTHEKLDPVRFIGNRSSGLMGHAVAAAAEARGARVTLVTTSRLIPPRGVDVVHVDSAAEMGDVLRSRAATADILVMAAAVADFRPRNVAPRKMAKADVPETLELELNDDGTDAVYLVPSAGAAPSESINSSKRLPHFSHSNS